MNGKSGDGSGNGSSGGGGKFAEILGMRDVNFVSSLKFF